ncbi:phosphotransferase [Streptomyces achromogenes]|uniref:phosphotransferase n=1 Tax=Streptomyces achromogenes TaxID=67255 RepID=UPI003702E6A9
MGAMHGAAISPAQRAPTGRLSSVRTSQWQFELTIGQGGRMPESPLPGGFVNAVVRVGDTVRRPVSARTRFVGDLLRLFEARGWSGAPRYFGVDDEGREVLSYLVGHVAWEPRQPAAVSSDESLVTVARLVREFHDLTAGTPLAGDQEVVCHNDLSPKNTVYRLDGGELRPAAFIDWDLAAPGTRIHDIWLMRVRTCPGRLTRLSTLLRRDGVRRLAEGVRSSRRITPGNRSSCLKGVVAGSHVRDW